MLDGWQWHDAL
jgi:hypothetical protein